MINPCFVYTQQVQIKSFSFWMYLELRLHPHYIHTAVSENKDTAGFLRLNLVSSLTHHLSGSETEQFRDSRDSLLLSRSQRGVSLCSGTNGEVWRRLHGGPLRLVMRQSCDYFTEENKPVCITHVSVSLHYLTLFHG